MAKLSNVANAYSLQRATNGLARKGIQSFKSNPMGAFAVATSGFAISHRMQQGDSFISAAGKEVAEDILYTLNPGLMMAAQMAPLAYQGVKAAHDFRERKTEELHDLRYNMYGRIGGGYMDTNRALTMRQAAVQQIQGNKLNARSALGGEARLFANNIY